MQKTDAIILNSTKYGDNKLIINTITRQNGRMAFSLQILANKKQHNPLPYCQPLFQNEIEFSGGNNLNTIKKCKNITPNFMYTTIPFSITKTSIAMFLSEILSRVLSHSEKNIEIYDYISTSLKILDTQEFKGTNFHLKFMLQLAKYMGFYPANRYSLQKPCFDTSQSTFTADTTGVAHLIRPPYSLIFNKLLDINMIDCDFIEINGEARNYLLDKILEYYRYRFDNLDKIKSLDILHKIFN